ncbi:MAG: hypothetical protein IT427_07645, partial [Pirellulales bacterium]|nr:hypothetical protein [Pirellulales bacterium]
NVYWQLRTGGGTTIASDTVSINVESMVWPNQDASAEWDPEAPSTHWNGFVLPEGWFISKSLTDIIVEKRAGGSNFGYIRTEYPQESQTTAGRWEGTPNQNSDATLDLYALAGMGSEGWTGETVRIEVTYEFEQSPNITTGDYVDVQHPTKPNLYKEGFFHNSGIKIENMAEIQIYDTAALLDSINGGSSETIDGAVETVNLDAGHNVNTPGTVNLDHGGADWEAEQVSALISGIPYNTNNEHLNMGVGETYAGQTFMQRLTNAPQGGQTMIIEVTRGTTPGGPYTLTVTIDGHTDTFANVQRGDLNKMDPGKLYLQSHWGSGVKFTSAEVSCN